ncbi:anti-sigma factor family protein [Aquibacillus saliphilus]|uniref:anti-sigma factor family protein n=1 Tax=Aquibacillus saliphilus TaxID=1909422 RepID=UPI001CF08840|nr:anti-sigma factor [Aquibacillus saliphilus]
MTCKNEIIYLMHKYLDGHLAKEEEKQLRSHLQSCEACQQHFHELKRTVTLLKSNSHIQAPDTFTNNVMGNLPKEKKRVSYMRWFKGHPVITAAAVFFIFMFGSMFTAWDQDTQLTVSKNKDLVIQSDNTVIVPEGITVEGDLVIKNGDLKIDGSVNGDVTIINGQHLRASAGDITGEIEQINQVFEWIWYHVKDMTKSVFALTKR